MKKSFLIKPTILPLLGLLVMATALTFSGCSQDKSKTVTEIGPGRWIIPIEDGHDFSTKAKRRDCSRRQPTTKPLPI